MKKNSLMILGAVILAVVLLGAAVLLGTGDEADEKEALSENITPQQYQVEFLEKNVSHLLIDVRTPEEYSEGHIADSVNISLQTLTENLDKIPSDQPVVVYCRSGNRSAQAADLLKEAGYSQIYDMGGIIDWQSAGYEVER